MRISERKLRLLQRQRHMYDIQMMILSSPIFKNLDKRDQKKLQKLIYKAEMAEIYIRDKNVIRVNQSFEDIVENVMNNIIDNSITEEEEEERRRAEDGEDY